MKRTADRTTDHEAERFLRKHAGHRARPDAERAGHPAADPGAARHAGGAAADLPARPVLHLQHHALADDPVRGDLRAAAHGLQRLPDRAAGRHAAAPGPERGLDARGADGGPPGPGRRRPGHRGLRPLHHRRQFRGRHCGLRHSGDHQLHGGDQGRRPCLGSDRALHPRRHAGQADGHRRRPQRRHHLAGRSAQAPRRRAHRVRLLRCHGRRQQVRQGRCHRRHPDPAHQPGRWHGHRHDAARPERGDGGRILRAAQHRRRPGGADPGAAAVDRGGHHRHPHFAHRDHERAGGRADAGQPARALPVGHRAVHRRGHSGHAAPGVPAAGRCLFRRRLAGADARRRPRGAAGRRGWRPGGAGAAAAGRDPVGRCDPE
ncbi:UNVERIFIED_CONTAM: hypothetical protein NCL1_01316 [Trichonephila clavipes]